MPFSSVLVLIFTDDKLLSSFISKHYTQSSESCSNTWKSNRIISKIEDYLRKL